jgi:Recombination endonuclease VII
VPYAREGRKVCSACRRDLPLSDFHSDKTHKDGLSNQCRDCKTVSARKWRLKNAAKQKSYSAEWHRRKRYGLTRDEFMARVEACGGLCEICRRPQHPAFKVLDVDHNHVTGRVRGLLCRECNNALRCEDPAILRAMADYLERHAEVTA